MAKKVLIIGGGIIGLFSAYYLQKNGHQVTVVDRNDFTDNCSYGNAGLIVPSHIVPMASPGMVSTAFRYLFNSSAPLAIKFPPSLDFFKWSFRFISSANHRHIQKSSLILKELSLLSKSLYKEVVIKKELSLQLNEKGLLIVCGSEKVKREEAKVAEIANKLGINAKVLSKDQLLEMEPVIKHNISGGVYYSGDCHLVPSQLMKCLLASLENSGVTFVSNAILTTVGQKSNSYTYAVINDEKFEFDNLVITAGAWSNDLLKFVKTKVPLQPGRGYSFDIQNQNIVKYPALLIDARVSVTPFSNGTVRFGGGMELGYSNNNVIKKRFYGICKSIKEYYPSLNIKDFKVWQGHRPCSFDGLPYIGRVPDCENIYLATGHSMMGITLAPVTGKLISELIGGKTLSVDPYPFRLDR